MHRKDLLGTVGEELKKRVKRTRGEVRNDDHTGIADQEIGFSPDETVQKERLDQVRELLEQAENITDLIQNPWVKLEATFDVSENGPAHLNNATASFEALMLVLDEVLLSGRLLFLFLGKEFQALSHLLDKHRLTEAQLKRLEEVMSTSGDSLIIKSKIDKQHVQNGLSIDKEHMEGRVRKAGTSYEARIRVLSDNMEMAYLQQMDMTGWAGQAMDSISDMSEFFHLRGILVTAFCRTKQYELIFEMITQDKQPSERFRDILVTLVGDKRIPTEWRKKSYELLKSLTSQGWMKYTQRASFVEAEREFDPEATAPDLAEEKSKGLIQLRSIPASYLAIARIRHAYGKLDAVEGVRLARQELTEPVCGALEIWIYLLETEKMLEMDGQHVIDAFLDDVMNAGDMNDRVNAYEDMADACARCVPERASAFLERAVALTVAWRRSYPNYAEFADDKLRFFAKCAAVAAATIDKERYTVAI